MLPFPVVSCPPPPAVIEVPATCVMPPPTVLTPGLVTVVKEPDPVAMFRSVAAPVPPVGLLTVMVTGAFVVAIELPAFIVKP